MVATIGGPHAKVHIYDREIGRSCPPGRPAHTKLAISWLMQHMSRSRPGASATTTTDTRQRNAAGLRSVSWGVDVVFHERRVALSPGMDAEERKAAQKRMREKMVKVHTAWHGFFSSSNLCEYHVIYVHGRTIPIYIIMFRRQLGHSIRWSKFLTCVSPITFKECLEKMHFHFPPGGAPSPPDAHQDLQSHEHSYHRSTFTIQTARIVLQSRRVNSSLQF